MAAATVMAVAAVIGAAAGGYSAYKSHEAAEEQEDLQKEQARLEIEASKGEAANIREKGKRLVASQRAALASSGVKVDEGTGDALQQETKRLTEQDALAVLKEGNNRASLLRGEAKISGERANAAAVSGVMDVAGTAASGYASYNKIKTPKTTTATPGSSATAANFATRSAPKYSLLSPSSKYSVN